MRHRYQIRILIIGFLLGTAFHVPANAAQQLQRGHRAWASNVIVPQVGAYSTGRQHGVKIALIRAGAVIVEQVATTTLEISLANPYSTRQQAELLIPVPDGAVVRSFVFQGTGAEPSRMAPLPTIVRGWNG